MAENITRTIYGSYLQTCKQLGLPFVLAANTTLNEKFGIQQNVVPDSNQIPNMRYFSIGNGGHRMTIGAGGVAMPEPVQHLATDAALYKHLPFVLRETNNDLTTAERAHYALRRTEVHNGITYVAYYLKRMDLTGVAAAMEHITVTDGISSVSSFVPDNSNLNPVPPVLSSSGVNVVSGDYVAATAKIGLVLSQIDAAELLNVATVLFNDDNYAIISEIALCSGVDKLVAVTGAGSASFNFTEAIGVQVVSHINTVLLMKFSNNGTEVLLDVGATEPLFNIPATT